MIGCGTTIFTDPDDFRANLPGPAFDLVLTGHERFRARLSWLKMAQLSVVHIEESAPRIAFLSLPAASIFVSFPLRREQATVWNGTALKPGLLVLHSEGDRFHQRLTGTARWGMAWLPRTTLLAHGRALLCTELALPVTKIVDAPSDVIQRFRRLHAQACRLAQSRPEVASHPEAVRALEQELIHALVHAIAANVPQDADVKRRHHADVMSRFERVLASRSDRPLTMAELSAGVGVPERTLRMRCAEFLGMSPLAYARLRRLNLAHWTFQRADSRAASVARVARKFGFSELGRFAAAYRAIFGEAPSATLRGAVSRIQGAP
jgi:AraC-like DNA-binding protein